MDLTNYKEKIDRILWTPRKEQGQALLEKLEVALHLSSYGNPQRAGRWAELAVDRRIDLEEFLKYDK